MSDRHGLALLALVGALTAWPAVASAEGPVAPPPVSVCAHLRLVDGDTDARALLGELGDVLSADLPRLDVAMAPAQEVSRLFRSDDPDAACVTAWVLVEATRARVRVAGAGRCRYVFRELDLEHPLSELDRERLAQVTNAALSAAVGDNAESTECAPPPVVVAPIAPARSVPAPAATTPPLSTVRSAPNASAPFSSLAIGASYGGTYYLSSFRPGPGLSVVAAEPSWLYDPEIWIELRYVPPSSSENGDLQTITGRVGVSARWWPFMRYGLGVGVDRVETTFEPPAGQISSPFNPSTYRTWEPAARAFARIASPSWNALSLSLTVLVDVVHSPDPQNAVRGGLVVEGWWHS